MLLPLFWRVSIRSTAATRAPSNPCRSLKRRECLDLIKKKRCREEEEKEEGGERVFTGHACAWVKQQTQKQSCSFLHPEIWPQHFHTWVPEQQHASVRGEKRSLLKSHFWNRGLLKSFWKRWGCRKKFVRWNSKVENDTIDQTEKFEDCSHTVQVKSLLLLLLLFLGYVTMSNNNILFI